ncbi:hypothetical protein COO60DRAFT_1189217 [Scenedesmus sp. NREL 46B-D3]|nr:hypothetical protein COO60DRAFT_1189217 [Scenedesmus sp. NREL 46B-D3]
MCADVHLLHTASKLLLLLLLLLLLQFQVNCYCSKGTSWQSSACNEQILHTCVPTTLANSNRCKLCYQPSSKTLQHKQLNQTRDYQQGSRQQGNMTAISQPYAHPCQSVTALSSSDTHQLKR